MSSQLPDFVDPWRLAGLEKTFSGQIELARLPRLAAVLANNAGHAEFELRFGRDDKRRVRITGSVRATLVLECQRCLEEMQQAVDVGVNLVVIEVEAEAEQLAEEVDPILVVAGQIGLLDLIEDELLLSIPQVPRHARESCGIDSVTMELAAEPEDTADKPNPFAVLEGLKSNSPN